MMPSSDERPNNINKVGLALSAGGERGWGGVKGGAGGELGGVGVGGVLSSLP